MTDYSFLTDPAEIEWLTNVDPSAVLANAHRMYDFMAEGGMSPDSFTRELAFTKASEALGIDYDVLYTAWLNGVASSDDDDDDDDDNGCQGHPDGPEMGVTFYCDGTCRTA